MLFNGFATPLHLRRKPSRILAGYLVILHASALLALLQPLAVGRVIQVLLILVWIISVVLHWRYYRRQRDAARRYWVWQADGNWVNTGEDSVYTLSVAQGLQTPWFVRVVLVSPAGEPRRLLIFRDQLDADTYRRLHVRLKLHHDKAAVRCGDSA